MDDAAFETGFWETVQACEAHGLALNRHELPILRLFFQSGHAFATPDQVAWRSSVGKAARRYRLNPAIP